MLERDDIAGASDQFEKAQRIRTRVFGPNHPAVIECLDALFSLHLRSGNVVDAQRHLEHGLAVREALGQRDHPVAVWFRFIKNHLFGDDAEPAMHSRFEEVISVTERAFSKNHPELADWRQWLADDLLRKEDIDRAEENYRQALEIDQRAYGGAHWRVARDLLRVFLILRPCATRPMRRVEPHPGGEPAAGPDRVRCEPDSCVGGTSRRSCGEV